MSTRFSLTINQTTASDGETRRAETSQIADILRRAADQVQSQNKTSATLYDRNGQNVGSFTYTPSASA